MFLGKAWNSRKNAGQVVTSVASLGRMVLASAELPRGGRRGEQHQVEQTAWLGQEAKGTAREREVPVASELLDFTGV